ncbi:MAG: mechanosensitive ion channel family protein [Bacteroidetes bacterium]|nr:mechanosensitive ion channel family protein [Bacteroidota bacterium]
MLLLLDIDWNFFREPFLGETVADYCWFGGILLATLLLRRPLSLGLSNIGHNLSSRISKEKHHQTFLDMLRKPIERLFTWLLIFIAFLKLSKALDSIVVLHRDKGIGNTVDIRLGDVIDHVFELLLIFSATVVVSRFIDFAFYIQRGRANTTDNKERQQLLPLVKEVVKLFIWTISFFWILGSVFHVNIPALITGLGIGGIAIALAAKESVENLFAAFTILSDKPFQVGDTIRTGNFEGVVERIGFRSTRLRGSDGNQLIVPNQKMVSENLENLTDSNFKSIKLNINIKYGVPHEKLDKMIEELKAMVRKTTHVQEPVEVILEGFGEQTFRISVSYHIPYPWDESTSDKMIQQEINMQAYEIAYRHTEGNIGKISSRTHTANREEDKEEHENEEDLGGLL